MAAFVVIDDRPEILDIIQLVLNLDKHTVRIFTNGHEAMAALLVQSCDILFCDLNMPVVSGYTVVANLRALSQFHNMIIIALSAAEDLQQDIIMAAGFSGILPKPFRAAELRQCIARYWP